MKARKAAVTDLGAAIATESTKLGSLATRSEELSGSIPTDQADLKAATEIRSKEQADFAKEEADLVEVIDTLERAIAVLQGEMQGGGSSNIGTLAKALDAMVQASAFSSADASRLTALVSELACS